MAVTNCKSLSRYTIFGERNLEPLRLNTDIYRSAILPSANPSIFAGIVWGLDEDRVLTVAVASGDGALLDEFHVHVADEKEAFSSVKSFLRSWGIKQVNLEDLSTLERVKSRVDGPLSIESSAWKRKMEACVKLQSRLQDLGVKIKAVNSTVENYTRCFSYRERLTREFRRPHRRRR